MADKGQSITIKIADRAYPLMVKDADQERCFRLAAESVNAKLAAFNSKYPTTDFADKMVIIALNETVHNLTFRKKQASAESEAQSLENELLSYLEKISR